MKEERISKDLRTLEVSVSPEGAVTVSLSSENNTFEELKEVAKDIIEDVDLSREGSQDYIG